MRREPDVELALFGRRQLRRRPVRADVPGLVAVHLRVLLLAAEDRLRERQLIARRSLLVVDRARVALSSRRGHSSPAVSACPKKRVHAGAGVLDRFHVPHRLLRILQDALRILRNAGNGNGEGESGDKVSLPFMSADLPLVSRR